MIASTLLHAATSTIVMANQVQAQVDAHGHFVYFYYLHHPNDYPQLVGTVPFVVITSHGPPQPETPLHTTAFAPHYGSGLPPTPPTQRALTLHPCLGLRALWNSWLIVQASFLQQYIKAVEFLKALYSPVDSIMAGRNLYSTRGSSHLNAGHPSFRGFASPPGQDHWARAPYVYYQSMMANSRAPAGYHHLSHKTALCKHFTRAKGYCPMGEMCNFVHDLSLCGIPDERARSTPGPSVSVPGTAYFPKKMTHCWAFVHGLCKVADCPYVHPADTAPFLKYTPCLAWPTCFYGDECRFKHPEPLPVPLPVVQTVFHPEARNVRPLEHHRDMRLPHSRLSQGGAVYYHQPFQQRPALVSPAPHLRVKSLSNVVAPTEDFSSFELRYERTLNTPSPVSPRAIVAPMSMDQAVDSEAASSSASTKEPAVQKRKTLPPSLRVIAAVQSEKRAAQEFPHTPTVISTSMARKGHARRISVSVKSELDKFAKASPSTPVAHVKRQIWAAFSAVDRHSNGFPC